MSNEQLQHPLPPLDHESFTRLSPIQQEILLIIVDYATEEQESLTLNNICFLTSTDYRISEVLESVARLHRDGLLKVEVLPGLDHLERVHLSVRSENRDFLEGETLEE